jgi:hypothetical protein
MHTRTVFPLFFIVFVLYSVLLLFAAAVMYKLTFIMAIEMYKQKNVSRKLLGLNRVTIELTHSMERSP